MIERIKVLDQIAHIEDIYCKICTEDDRTVNFCINNCEHGITIRDLGKKIEGESNKLRFYTKEEDEIIIAGRKEGKSFKDIAEELPSRTISSVRDRSYKIIKKVV